MTDSHDSGAQSPRYTPLRERHEALGASFTDFGGWQMPVRYTSDLAEHRAVREAAGIFDISHMAEVVVAFTNPGDRNKEYANSAAHARFVTHELVPHLESQLPLLGGRAGRALMGASFGGVASLTTAYRAPDAYGSLILQSGSFVFTDFGMDHGGGEVFDPVVRFVNRYRAQPRKVADRAFVSCGMYEPLITPNRSMVPVFEGTGMDVRYVEARDGHSWEDWRDRLRDALAWTFPGPQKYVYE